VMSEQTSHVILVSVPARRRTLNVREQEATKRPRSHWTNTTSGATSRLATSGVG
jgi:hypothetical protein